MDMTWIYYLGHSINERLRVETNCSRAGIKCQLFGIGHYFLRSNLTYHLHEGGPMNSG